MIGNTLSEFIDDILTMGGPEKEFLFHGKKYMLQSQKYEDNPSLTELVIFECFGDETMFFAVMEKISENVLSNLRKLTFLME